MCYFGSYSNHFLRLFNVNIGMAVGSHCNQYFDRKLDSYFGDFLAVTNSWFK